MKIVNPISILIAFFIASAGAAMADKTWNSDPSIYEAPGREQWTAPMAAPPLEAAPVLAPPKSYRL